jgi:hypothetical protein
MALDYGTFGSPLSIEKANDQVHSFFVIVDINFVFIFSICLRELQFMF